VAVECGATPYSKDMEGSQNLREMLGKASGPISLSPCTLVSLKRSRSNWQTLLLLKKKKPGKQDFAEKFTLVSKCSGSQTQSPTGSSNK